MNNENALWLPPKSIRAILALMLTAATIVAVFQQVPIEFVALISNGASACWGLYFGEALASKANGKNST